MALGGKTRHYRNPKIPTEAGHATRKEQCTLMNHKKVIQEAVLQKPNLRGVLTYCGSFSLFLIFFFIFDVVLCLEKKKNVQRFSTSS